MTATGRPEQELPDGAEDAVCTHCGSADVELESLFGGSISECLFRCRSCRSFFHWLKWR